MEYEELLGRWTTNKQTDTSNMNKVLEADHLLKELAILECMKNISVSTGDSGYVFGILEYPAVLFTDRQRLAQGATLQIRYFLIRVR